MTRYPRRRTLIAFAASSLVASALLATPAAADPNNNSVRKLTKAVTLEGVLQHSDAFQAIADANGDNRASGLPGYDASADYVADLLRGAGYQVSVQPFDFPYFEEFGSSFRQIAPVPTTYVDGVQYDLMDYSGDGVAQAGVVAVDVNLSGARANTSGCEAADFRDAAGVSIVTGKIALLQRGTCPFGQKVTNAEAAGAIGAVVFNQGNGDPVANSDRYNLLQGTLGGPVGIPAVGTDFALGASFVNTPGLILRIEADTISTIRSTSNVLAQTTSGRTDNVVMAGAHLDSEPDTTGINDNGSGSAALLEVALQMAKVKTPNAVRFAWWGAEEANLLGSTFYVNSLSDEEIDDIALYLNFDMIGSPNYTFGVYDGDDSAAEGSGPGPAGSAAIEAVFQDFCAGRGEATNASDFTGRSDYGPFIAAGVDIPAGGLFTGAETIKSAADVAQWGGLAGRQMDVCYHDPCDSLTPQADGAPAGVHAALEATGYDLYGNLNTYALDVNADAIATSVLTFAYDTSAVNGVAPGPGKSHGDGKSEDAHGHATR